tara:strand:+ start:309 stop:938 length:630 start_codon:yes stop_codon:yes gene_type:complete
MYLIERNYLVESEYKNRLTVIGSFPRSGSHWTRRMLAELIAINNNLPTPSFGKELEEVAGFNKEFEGLDWRKTHGPLLIASHSMHRYGLDNLSVYLRRDFEEVYQSTLKAVKEREHTWWYGGSREACHEMWVENQALGCAHAKIVMDYSTIRSNPKAAIQSICDAIQLPYTDESLDRAVAAGSRTNMLAEQSKVKDLTFQVINQEKVLL